MSYGPSFCHSPITEYDFRVICQIVYIQQSLYYRGWDDHKQIRYQPIRNLLANYSPVANSALYRAHSAREYSVGTGSVCH